MPLKKPKDQESASNLQAWTHEPNQGALTDNSLYAVRSDPNVMSEYNQPSSLNHSGNQHQTQPNSNYVQRHVVFDGPAQWPDKGAPMAVKRGKDKKKKKDKKKHKKSDIDISTPMNVRHVGMQNQTASLDERSNYAIEHLASMPMDGQLAHISPYESIRKVRGLILKGNIWTQQIILSVTQSKLTILDGSTRTSLIVIPLNVVVDCKYIQDSEGNILILYSQDPSSTSGQPKMHVFQCTKVSAETICNQINQFRRHHASVDGFKAKDRKVKGSVEQSDSLSSNWILEPKSRSPADTPNSSANAPFPPPPSHSPLPPPPSHPPPPPGQSYSTVLAVPQASNSPALPGNNLENIHYMPAAQSFRAPGQQLDFRGDESVTSSNLQKLVGNVISKTTTKYTSSVHRPSIGGNADSDIKRTIKASKIQRDVDILNHVFDDLEGFKQLLTNKAIAWKELEKKSQKSRRKKNDAALEDLKKKAEPPDENLFILTYQKCKYGINQIAKLGHHLSSPSSGELLREIFKFLQHFINLNKGPQLVSGVVAPLFTSTAYNLMTKKLLQKEQELWNQLGGNWLITVDQWPQHRPLPQDYVIEFSDGCIPPNLHNSSDSPANFPTLDTLPREQRGTDYSDAYDGGQVEESSRLMINPAVMAAVASKASMVMSPILPGIINRRPSDTSTDAQLMGAHLSTRSQQSLNSDGSNETDDKKMAKVILDYQASALEELTIRRAEKVEIIDDSKKWWKVKNRLGAEGYVPSNLLEVVIYKKKTGSRNDLRLSEETINIHGRSVPVPPKNPPPPVPSPANNRHLNSSSMKQPPQMAVLQPRGKSFPHPQSLPTLTEVSESRSSTMSRLPLAPPPPFSPAPPPGHNFPGFPPPPPPGLGGGAPPPPPPPPVVQPAKQTSLNDMISKHKLKTAKEGKSQKKKLNQPDNGFDITTAMKTRQPLRKTTTAIDLRVGESAAVQSETQNNLRLVKSSTEKNETDSSYIVLPWKADLQGVKQWLTNNGYSKCAENVAVSAGHQLYAKSRDYLKEICGISEGARLFSQLQKDKQRAEQEGGASKQSEFQKLMQSRKVASDAGNDNEPALVRGWGNNSAPYPQDESRSSQPSWKEEVLRRKSNKLTEKETILDDTLPRLRNRLKRKDTIDMRGTSSKESTLSSRRRRHSDRDSREVNNYEDSRERRRGQGTSDRYRKDKPSKERGQKTSHSRAISDDEDYRSKHKRKGKRDTWSDYDSDYEERRRWKGTRSKRPTNIDDFDEDDYSDTTDSNSSDYTDTESSESDSGDSSRRRRRRNKLRSSASVSELTSTAWALSGEDGKVDNIEQRIKYQQAEIKKQLSALTQLQSDTGVKALPGKQQTILQNDLQKLEQLQTKLRYKQGNQDLQMQLLGQQMLLCEHLKEAQRVVIKKPTIGQSSSGQSLRLQMLQQQQQALAEQQRLLLFEQQRQVEYEQQVQMQMAVEQQRQMQMTHSMGPFQGPQFMSPVQQGFGYGGVPQPMYSPYSGTVGFY